MEASVLTPPKTKKNQLSTKKFKGTRASQAIALYNQANDFLADTDIANALGIGSRNVVTIRNSIVKLGYGFRVRTVYCEDTSKYCLVYKLDRRGKGYKCVEPIKDSVEDSVFDEILAHTASPMVEEVIKALRLINDDYWEMDDLIKAMNQSREQVKNKFYYFTRHYDRYVGMHVRDDYIHPRTYLITAPFKKPKPRNKDLDIPELVIPIYLTPEFSLLNKVFSNA